MKKITKREMYQLIKALAADGFMDIAGLADGMDIPENFDADAVIEFCDNEIANLDKKASKAKETAAKKKSEDPLLDIVANALTPDYETIPVIAKRVLDNTGNEEYSQAKVQYRLRVLVENGEAEKNEVAIKDDDGKKKKVMAYRLTSWDKAAE